METNNIVQEIPVNNLLDHPDNPRGVINPETEDIQDLAASIKEQGVIEPLIVTKGVESRFFVIAGHRRKAASIVAGLTTVPCIVRVFENKKSEIEIMLVENLQREGLSPIQEARAYKQMLELGHTQQHIAYRCGISAYIVGQRLDLLSLDVEVQTLIHERNISIKHGLILTGIRDITLQRDFAIRAQRMSADSLSSLVGRCPKGFKSKTKKTKGKAGRPPKYEVNPTLAPDETFTRSRALKRLLNQKNCNVKLSDIADSFDDVCQDACVQAQSEALCEACPVPRLIESILRRINL